MVQPSRICTRPRLSAAGVMVISLLILCTGPQDTRTKPDSRDLKNTTASFIYNAIPPDPQAIVSPEYTTAVNEFSVTMLNEICRSDTFRNRNVVVSPFCASRNLAIITEAASGSSRQELLAVLGGRAALDDAAAALSRLLYADNSILIQIADAAWVDSTRYTILPAFIDTAKKKYGIAVSGLNFGDVTGSVSTINQWVAANTANHITDAVKVEYIKPMITALILTSTIYFEADWASPFDVTMTMPCDFHAPEGTVLVPMMTSSYLHRTRKTGTWENARLYYGTGGKDFFYLDVYMPVESSVEEFIRNGCAEALNSGDSTGYGSLKMPKFFFENEINLEPALRSMGVDAPFDSEKHEITGMAFNKITQDSGLFLDLIVQKAGIKTDEEGTVAYAVTVSGIGAPTSAGLESPDVVLDHPFVYFIRAGATGLILFAGVVYNPMER